eukprot:scaffold42035_cov53-Attheya_sp.AAC.1
MMIVDTSRVISVIGESGKRNGGSEGVVDVVSRLSTLDTYDLVFLGDSLFLGVRYARLGIKKTPEEDTCLFIGL